jgi:AraC-like DNA-binding protein
MAKRPLIEKLTLTEDASFLARNYCTPQFEVPWHQHLETEIILFNEGEGTAFIGNYIGHFKSGDVFVMGANLPHMFQNSRAEMKVRATVIQFTANFWGTLFLELPEAKPIQQLLQTALQGLRLEGDCLYQLQRLLPQLETAQGFQRIILLCQCLQQIASTRQFVTVSTQEVKPLNSKQRERIDKVYQYTFSNFQELIALNTIAGIADMSVPAFCNYFRKSTKKTYIDFLTEVRIGYACRQLMETQKNIEAIGYESGFNTLANFNKQFLKIKKINPSQFRRQYSRAVTAALAPTQDAVRSFE